MKTKINLRISEDGSSFSFIKPTYKLRTFKIGWDIFDGDEELGCLFFYDSLPNDRRMSKYWKEYKLWW